MWKLKNHCRPITQIHLIWEPLGINISWMAGSCGTRITRLMGFDGVLFTNHYTCGARLTTNLCPDHKMTSHRHTWSLYKKKWSCQWCDDLYRARLGKCWYTGVSGMFRRPHYGEEMGRSDSWIVHPIYRFWKWEHTTVGFMIIKGCWQLILTQSNETIYE